MNAVDSQSTPPSAQANISTVAEMERKSLDERTTSDKIADSIANFVGSIPFVGLHVVWFGVWVFLNAGLIKFDPYPFQLLCMLVSLEGVLLSTFVLIKQNRMGQRGEQRDHLDLQINLLTEQEVTKMLQLQRLICRKLDIREADLDREVVELSNVTAVENLAHDIDKNLPVED